MPGSNIKINLPYSGNNHNDLSNRNSSYQHILESVYRKTDGKNLNDIIEEIKAETTTVLFERFVITDPTQVIDITNFSYNMAKDVLFIDLDGHLVYEGTDEDYVKTSPTQIKFNYKLIAGQEVLILLAGTISSKSFGNDIHNELNQFKQLVDVPSTYYGHSGKVATVNNEETGLVFKPIKASHNLVAFEQTLNISEESYWEGWVPFVNAGIIKVIRVTPTIGYVGEYTLSIWTNPGGEWVYYSGDIPDPNIGSTVLYDVMEIAHIDKSAQDSIYLRIDNFGTIADFKLEIIVDK